VEPTETPTLYVPLVIAPEMAELEGVTPPAVVKPWARPLDARPIYVRSFEPFDRVA